MVTYISALLSLLLNAIPLCEYILTNLHINLDVQLSSFCWYCWYFCAGGQTQDLTHYKFIVYRWAIHQIHVCFSAIMNEGSMNIDISVDTCFNFL